MTKIDDLADEKFETKEHKVKESKSAAIEKSEENPIVSEES